MKTSKAKCCGTCRKQHHKVVEDSMDEYSPSSYTSILLCAKDIPPKKLDAMSKWECEDLRTDETDVCGSYEPE